MTKDDLIALQVVPEKTGYSIYFDDKEIHHIETYKIEKAALSGTAKLTVEILVKYP